MPQVLKEGVRRRILDAALEELAASGFLGASMSAIAARAGLGTASLYRYYASKEELFNAVITPEITRQLGELLDRRVRALAAIAFSEGQPAIDDEGEAMLRFWIEHRLAVVVLLDRAQGTVYEAYGQRFVERLTNATLAEIRAAHPGVRVSAAARFVLERIFESTRRTLAAILEEHDSEPRVREAIAAFWSYQIPGLRGFAAWVTRRR